MCLLFIIATDHLRILKAMRPIFITLCLTYISGNKKFIIEIDGKSLSAYNRVVEKMISKAWIF